MQIDRFFPYRLAVVAEAFSRRLAAVYGRRHGLSREEWRLLFLLQDEGTLDSLRLAQRTSLDKVQVSRAAARLQSKGLITREVLGADRRLRNYALTDAGRALARQVFGDVRGRAERILSAMSAEDRAALFRGIEALDRAISATDRDNETPAGPGDAG